MKLFHTLHRVYLLGWVLLIAGGAVWVYSSTGISEPLVDWYAVWRNKSEVAVKPVAEISGTVIKVLDGTSFTLRAKDHQLFNIALLGTVSSVAAKTNSTTAGSIDRGKALLSDLILSNDVQLTLTFLDPSRRGMGVVHLGETNVNACMVESGLVGFKREFVKGLPLLEQYAFLRADRKSKEHKPNSSN